MIQFEKQSFKSRLKSMLKVDFRRMLTMPLFYIMLGVSIVIPVLILVMTTMMDGTTSVNPSTGAQTTMEGFKNTWQAIGALSSQSSNQQGMAMDLTSMCNINMMYFMIAVVACIFVCDDFRSGYAKNLFTTRSSKKDYVISKSLVCFMAGACMILGFFIGTIIGGGIAGLPFDTFEAGVSGIIMCLLSKICVVGVFVPIFLVMSVVGKQRLWLAIILSFGCSMLLYSMVPMITPLDSTILNAVLCLAGGVLFSFGIGAISNIILKKTSLV